MQLFVGEISSGVHWAPLDDEKSIVFTSKNMAGVSCPHDDTEVVAVMIGKYNIHRVLVNTGSSTGILYTTTYEQIKLEREK